MAHEDKLIGVTIADGTTTRTYSAYRIDYDDNRSLEEIADVETLDSHYTSRVKTVSQTAIDRGYHTPKDGYQRLVLVADATTRDEVQADLDAESVVYTTEDVSPTTQEKLLIEREDATNISEVHDALEVQNDILERKLVSETSKQNIATSIDNLSAGDQKDALEGLYEILTGETVSETLQ